MPYYGIPSYGTKFWLGSDLEPISRATNKGETTA